MKINDIYLQINDIVDLVGVEKGAIGSSTLGQEVPYFFVGNKKGKTLLIEAGIHAREYIGTLLTIELIKYYAENILDFGIYFVPLSNPDGVAISLEGMEFELLDEKKRVFLQKINKNADNFELWKANVNGVDLNVNFDAMWGKGKKNTLIPSSANFVGDKPESEIEVKNLINFANEIKPNLVLSLHSKGEVIFFGFEQMDKKEKKRDKFIAKQMQKVCNFKPVKTRGSVGGFTDWVSLNLKVPSFTIELGNDKLSHPIKKENLAEIFNQIKYLPLVAMDALNKINSIQTLKILD